MRRVLLAVPSHYLALTVLPGLFLVAALMVRGYLTCFILATKEGSIAEVGTVTFLLVAASLAALNVRLAWREPRYVRLHLLFFGALTLALLFGAAEELSYGQRILGVETPEFFEENSRQDEINLHNLIEGFDENFDTLKVLERLTWAFGIVLPIFAKKSRVPIPSLFLVPGFFLATELMQSRVHGQEREFGEWAVSIGLALFLLMEWQKRNGREFRLSLRGLALSGLMLAVVVPAVVFAAGQGCEARFCAGRPVIERLRAEIAPDVAVISVQDVESYTSIFLDCNLQAPNVFRAFYLDDDPAPVNAMIDIELANYDEALGIYVGPERYDVTGLVESRLRDEAFEASIDYYDFVRVVRYGFAQNMGEPVALDDAVFGESIRLSSYAVDEAALSAGDVLDVALEWEALDTPDADYTVSVHLLDGEGALVAQHDGPPRSSTVPTSTWQAGDVIRDNHGIALPRDLAAGTYQLNVLLYNESGRLPVSAAGADEGDSLFLRDITIEAVN